MREFRRTPVVSFLASGSGGMFAHVAHRILKGNINARIGAAIADRKGAGVLKRAAEMGVRGYFVDPKRSHTREKHDEAMMAILERHRTTLVVAAGYLLILSGHIVERYRNRIINIHPSLLPSFPGRGGAQKALDYGVKVTGCTAHFVDEGMDTGPIIMQAPVIIREQETIGSLTARILREEYTVLAESVRLFCEGKLEVRGRRVQIGR